jgi:hypothetical protein
MALLAFFACLHSHSSFSPYVMPLGQNLCAAKVAAATEPRKTSEVLTMDSDLASDRPSSGNLSFLEDRAGDEGRDRDGEGEREREEDGERRRRVLLRFRLRLRRVVEVEDEREGE